MSQFVIDNLIEELTELQGRIDRGTDAVIKWTSESKMSRIQYVILKDEQLPSMRQYAEALVKRIDNLKEALANG